VTRSVTGCIPTQSVGTISGVTPQMTEHPAMRDNAGKFQE
jgi:hypothetical protein